MKKFALVALMAAMVSPAFAHNHETQDVVYDTRDDVVRSAVTKDCVYAANQTTDKANPCANVKELALAERTVYFAFNSSKLGAEEQAKLDTLAAYLMAHADMIKGASIVGYADRIGNTKYNDALSKKRAKTVLKYLTSKGVMNARLAEVRGLGESQPQTECQGDKANKKLISCLAPDRRVEVEIEFVK